MIMAESRRLYSVLLLPLFASLLGGCTPPTPAQLVHEALNSPNSWRRLDAVEQLNDQALLAQVAMKADQNAVGKAAAAKLTDETLLTRIAIESTSWRIAEQAVAGITDESLLTEIATESKSSIVAGAACGKIKSQELLAQIALNAKETSTRGKAVGKLTEQPALLKVALASKDFSLCSKIIKKLTDPTALVRVAVKCPNKLVRPSAVDRLTDQNALADVVLLAEDDRTRGRAALKLNAESAWMRVAMQISSPGYAESAVQEISKLNPSALSSIIKSAKLPYTRKLARVYTITDEKTLYEIALESEDAGISRRAVAGISDSALLTQLAVKAQGQVARLAVARLRVPAIAAGTTYPDGIPWDKSPWPTIWAIMQRSSDVSKVASTLESTIKYGNAKDAAKVAAGIHSGPLAFACYNCGVKSLTDAGMAWLNQRYKGNIITDGRRVITISRLAGGDFSFKNGQLDTSQMLYSGEVSFRGPLAVVLLRTSMAAYEVEFICKMAGIQVRKTSPQQWLAAGHRLNFRYGQFVTWQK